MADAQRDGLTLVTTEKDMARLRSGAAMPVGARDIVLFAITMEFDDAAGLRAFLSDRIFKAREKRFRGGS